MSGSITFVLGLLWGNECKSKLVDYLARSADVVARANGNDDEIRDKLYDGQTYSLRVVPSGFANESTSLIIGDGFLLNPVILYEELKVLRDAGISFDGRLLISNKCHIIMPYHKFFDERDLFFKYSKCPILTNGSSASMSDKALRDGVRFADLLSHGRTTFADNFEHICFTHLPKRIRYIKSYLDSCMKECDIYEEAIHYLSQFVCDTTSLINDYTNNGKTILVEGAFSSLFDVNHGISPFVYSDSYTSGSMCSYLGIGPNKVSEIIGVTKAYCSKIDDSPFVTLVSGPQSELFNDYEDEIIATSSPRRYGWLDLVALKYACMINGVTSLAITHLDTIGRFDKIKLCTSYNTYTDIYNPDATFLKSCVPQYVEFEGNFSELSGYRNYSFLPIRALDYLNYIEKYLGIPIRYIGTGEDSFIEVPIR